jgi:septal ring factor EnvC (AmiA/AmiB activator)
MKIIEGMKRIKYLHQKIDDLTKKIKDHCADYDDSTEMYANQKEKIQEWIQSCEDSIKEILKLRIAIQKTNLATECTIELGEKQITKTIAEWVHRKRDLAGLSKNIWGSLTDRGLRKFIGVKKEGEEESVAKLVLYFDSSFRDMKISEYAEEPSKIDGTLEVKNAVTDLIDI